MTSKRSTPDGILDLCIACIECRTRWHCHSVYNAWRHVCDIVRKWNLPMSGRNCHWADFGIWHISDSSDDRFCRWTSSALPSGQSFGRTPRIDRRNGALTLCVVSTVCQKRCGLTLESSTSNKRASDAVAYRTRISYLYRKKKKKTVGEYSLIFRQCSMCVCGDVYI